MRRLVIASLVVLIFLPLEASSEYGDVIMDQSKQIMAQVGLAPVLFPHWIHRINFKCKACHEGVFVMQKGANNITMSAIMKGEFCGECHDGKIAWDLIYCDRCHAATTPQ